MQFRLVTLLALLSIVAVVLAFIVPKPVRTPELFTQKEFDAAELAKAINYFVERGEEQSILELINLSTDRTDFSNGFDVNERIGWVCRILFKADKGETLRPPGYGTLTLPFNTKTASDWPIFPVAKAGDAFIVLSQGYSVSGCPESPREYIDYCQKNGCFRQEKVVILDRQTAISDINCLRKSKRWGNFGLGKSGITIIGGGFWFGDTEGRIWGEIIAQGEMIAQ